MSSSKKAETVTWWIVTANGAGIAKIIAYRGLFTTGQKLTHKVQPAGIGVPLIFGMPKECTGTTDEFVAHMNESRRDFHLKVKFYEAVKDQLEHRERDGYHYVALIDRH